MHESEGGNKEKLICYWHDDEDRNVEYENLEKWAEDVLNAAKP